MKTHDFLILAVIKHTMQIFSIPFTLCPDGTHLSVSNKIGLIVSWSSLENVSLMCKMEIVVF